MKPLIIPYLVLLELVLCSLICVPGVWANLTLFIDRPGDSEVCLAPGSLFMISGRVFAFDYAAEQYGTVTKVEIYQGLEKLGDALLDNPNGYCYWRFPWNPVREGSNTIQAIGFSSLGVETAAVAVVFIITNNTPPIARDVRAQVAVNATSHVINATYSDVDFYQFWSASVVDPPSHGSISNGPPGTMTFYYTPYAGYSGADSFTYQVDDSITNSNLATGRILVCRPNNPEGAMVAIVVNTSLFVNVLSNEILRLKSDLEAENYTAKIKLWPSSGTSASNVWSYLRENYTDTNAFFIGAILIGVIPKPQAGGIYNDLIYWNMDAFQTSSSRVYSRHIWVSFIKVEDLTWGSEVTLVRRALDANHAYRRGQSRLPFTAYRYKNPDWWSNRNYLSNVWPVVEQRGATSTNLCFLPERKDLGSVAGADCLVKGGELFEEESHGNGLGYMSSYGWVTKQVVHRNLVQVRVCLLGSCSSGVSGGIANEHIYSRGGGCVLAVGSTEDNFPSEGVISDDASFLSRLQAGRSWGDALVENFTIGQYANSAFFGDLSLRPMASGELNLMPEIGHFGASTSNAMMGQPVNFEVTASDPDGSVSNIEWFLNGFDGGRATPTFSGMATNVSYAYSSLGVYTTRVEVVDNYQARTWRESIITVTPLQTCTLMVVNSGQGGSSLGLTSPAMVTLPWGSSTQIVFEAADWHFIQALASNNISIEAAIGAKIYTQAYFNITADISNDVTFALATPLQTGYSNVPTSWLTNWAENAILIDPQFTVYEKYLIGLDPSTSNTFSLAIESVRVCESNVIMVFKRQYTGGLSPDGMHGHLELQATDRMDVPFTNVPGTEVTGIAVFDDTGRKAYTNSLPAATNHFFRVVVQ